MKRLLPLILLPLAALAACGDDDSGSKAVPAAAEGAAEAPETKAPETKAPATTEAATTAAPVTEAPTTVAPTTAAPATEPPVTEPPVTEPPVTEPPVTEAPTTAAPIVVTYTITNVVDGDTVNVVASDGSTAPVRLIGIDAPETNTCEGNVAAQALRDDLVAGTPVTLTMGGDGEDKDKYGRLLRYVDYDGNDVGAWMISTGNAIARYDSRDGYGRHDREDAYVTADAAAADYKCPPPPPPVTQPKPKPAAPATAAPAPAKPAPAPPAPSGGGDLDCSDIRHKVWVGDNDPHRLDADGDGWGCESYG